jgi:hypothetical protein
MVDNGKRTLNRETFRAFLVNLGPQGRKSLTIVFMWFFTMLAAAMGCGVVIGLLI